MNVDRPPSGEKAAVKDAEAPPVGAVDDEDGDEFV